MSNVPTNLIPSRVTQLPEYAGSSTLGYMPYVVDGRTYKVQFANIAAVGAVPSSRAITAGTGLAGGGDLSQDRVISIVNGGVGQAQLSLTGVVAGTYGSGTAVPVVTVDDTGRVTSVTTNSLSITGYVPDSRLVSAGAGLTGGGALLSDVTLSISFSSSTPEPLGTASAGVAVVASREDHVHPAVDLSDADQTQGALPLGRGGTGDALSPIAGAVVYSDATHFVLTGVGTAGQVLTSDGVNAPYWSTIGGLGTVTSVAASGGATGLTFSGSPITTSGTLTLGGTLAVASGGTGATTASTARANLGAAASGANSDITSLSGITGGISTADYVAFDTTNAVPPSTGQLAWNADDGTIDVGLNGGSVLQVGQETMYFAKNTSGGSIANGTPVMFTGAIGASGKLTFGLAVADGSVPAEYMMGVATQTIADNAFGYVTDFGLVRGFDASGTPYGETWADGDLLYFDPAAAGTWTNVRPAAPNIAVPVAVVINAAAGGSGSIFVRMVVSQRLTELQDVYINGAGTPVAGQTLIYDATQERWENHTLTAGSGISITNGDGSITIAATGGGSGTVTSVAASGGTTGLSFTGSPITTSGTLTLTGTLGAANGGTGATTLTGVVIGNGTSAFTAVTAPAGAIVGTTDTQTLANKRVDPRANAQTTTTSPWAWNSDSYDQQSFSALANALTINADTGTPVDGQKTILRFKDDGTTRTLTFTGGASKAFRDLTGLLTVSGSNWTYATAASKTVYFGCVYNSADARWDIIALTAEA